jgi:ArsR family transcriptional regulator, arsenate/arsenite/antimonite-responsive transcriptional repressor
VRELTKLMKVLSDESRLRVLNLLQERECCVCEVMQVMDISQSKASRILSALYDVGLLKLRREGRWALYSLESDRSKEYVNEILTGIKRSLTDDPTVAHDLVRLQKAQRVGPACVVGGCVTRDDQKSASSSKGSKRVW